MTVRILTTTDLIGSFHPQPTSYGHLPGAAALEQTAHRLRDEQPGLWIDTGDLAQGDPLGPLSDGVSGFHALAGLSIDAAAIGNHELDWGLPHLRRWSRELPFPFLAANADLGFAATATFQVDNQRIGVIGLTHPQLPTLHPTIPVHPAPAELVRDHASELRADGCTSVVLAIHDGVDRAGPARTDTQRISGFIEGLHGSVDLVLGGHTLQHHIGRLHGVPYLQPWPFGSQIGVADFHDDGTVHLSTVDVTGYQSWTGAGAGAYAELDSEIVGHLDQPLLNALDGRATLSQAVADGILAAAPEIDIALVSDMWNQPPRDHVLAYLPVGLVTRAQVQRVTPLCGSRSPWGGQLVATQLASDQAETVIAQLSGSGLAVARRANLGPLVTIALPAFHTTRLDIGPEPRTLEITWQDALLTWLDHHA